MATRTTSASPSRPKKSWHRIDRATAERMDDEQLLRAIADRYNATFASPTDRRHDAIVGIFSRVHARTPLRLVDWLLASDFGFMHDAEGLYVRADRESGRLDGFWPRFRVG